MKLTKLLVLKIVFTKMANHLVNSKSYLTNDFNFFSALCLQIRNDDKKILTKGSYVLRQTLIVKDEVVKVPEGLSGNLPKFVLRTWDLVLTGLAATTTDSDAETVNNLAVSLDTEVVTSWWCGGNLLRSLEDKVFLEEGTVCCCRSLLPVFGGNLVSKSKEGWHNRGLRRTVVRRTGDGVVGYSVGQSLLPIGHGTEGERKKKISE